MMTGRPPHDPAAVLVDHVELAVVDDPAQDHLVEADLRYDASDPFAVTMVFSSGAEQVRWTFARELLVEGSYAPVGEGDVRVWPCLDATGAAVVILELTSTGGEVGLQLGARDVHRFVDRMLALVPVGHEDGLGDLEDALGHILEP